jgi:NitT/TauT family transport system permease protein
MTLAMPTAPAEEARRPDFECEPIDASGIGSVERPLSLWERLVDNELARKTVLLVALAAIWEVYARILGNPLLFPTLSETLATLGRDVAGGMLPERVFTSLQVLAMGYAAGLTLAAVLTTLAVSTRIGSDLLSTLTSMFNPLPAIALLPLALIWFGLGKPSLVFVIVHSVLWAVSLNTLTGFRSVPETLRMSGRNLGPARAPLRRPDPRGLSGDPHGAQDRWAFAWRTLIAAELVFGVSSRSGGWAGTSSRRARSSRPPGSSPVCSP